jgi:DNA-binding GntR family transcriptional regulator
MRRTAKAAPESALEATDSAAERGRSVEEIAQDIAAAIIEKRLPPGTRLREEALGRVYAVSRTKIRAALLVVSKDKLIEIVPDKGAFVSKPSVQEAREVFAVRRVLEAEVVRLFVAHAKPAHYRMLEQHIKVERATLGAAAPGSLRERLLGDFHVQLAEAAGNKVLADLIAELVARCSLIAMLYESSNDPHCSSDEHGEFLRMAKAGDAAAAVDCMTRHLHRVEERLSFERSAGDRHLDLVKALLT